MSETRIIKDASLKRYNSFGIDAKCKHLVHIANQDDVRKGLEIGNGEVFILGGGSNMLLVANIEPPVLKNEIGGITIVEDTPEFVVIKVGGGVNWHKLVLWAVENGYGGFENLSLIPGTVGAAPIQNIGAYGVEQSSCFLSLTAVELTTGDLKTFEKKDCAFGYRDSYFKNEGKGKFFITSVNYVLLKQPKVNLSYGSIENTLKEKEILHPSIKDVSNVVIEIRQAKLPDPNVLGNSGSFFKNPIVDKSTFSELVKKKKEVMHYPIDGNQFKIPAGWLIDQCGWKGKKIGAVGCYEKQALVIVNHGGATGAEVWNFALKIQEDVLKKWGIELVPEVNIIR